MTTLDGTYQASLTPTAVDDSIRRPLDTSGPEQGKSTGSAGPNDQDGMGPLAAGAGSISPHFLVFTICEKGTKKPIVSWSILFGTKASAQSEMRYIQGEMTHLRGRRPWSEIARISKCRAPALLHQHSNLQMSIRARKPEDDPRSYRSPPSFLQRRHPDTVRRAPAGNPGQGAPPPHHPRPFNRFHLSPGAAPGVPSGGTSDGEGAKKAKRKTRRARSQG